MIRHVLALLWLVGAGLAGAAAAAQPVPVRSGEHDGFTRLVIDFSRRPEWRLGRAGGRHVLSTGQAGLRYDLAGIYRRIGRGRLAEIAGGADGELLLTLACECSLRAEELPNQGLVIDILDGPPPSEGAGEAMQGLAAPDIARPARRGASTGGTGRAVLPPVLAPAPAALLPGAFERRAPNSASPNAPAPNAPAPDPAVPDPAARNIAVPNVAVPNVAAPDPAGRSAVISAARLRLTETLARAAAQGLLAPASPATDVGGLAAPLRAVEGNLRARTRIDMDLGQAAAARAAPECLPPGRLDPAGWLGGGADAAAALATLRGALIDPTGAPDPAAHAALARAYIALTFGAEARALLRQAPPETPDRDLLSEMAQIVMGRVPAAGVLVGQIACPAEPALWAALALPRLPAPDAMAEDAIVAAHSALPDLLRRHLGGALVSRFLAAGRIDAARAVENAMTRTGPPASPEERLAAAEIDLQSGRRGEGESLLADLTASRSDEAAEAVIRLIESRVSAGEPAGDALAETAAALAHDYSGTAMDARLRAAELRALIGDGRFAAALDRLSRAEGDERPPPEGRDDLANLLVAELVERAEDTVFLPLAARALDLPSLSPETRRPLARRLAGLGLDAMAETALALQGRDPAAEDRLIMANVALLRRAPTLAIGYLSGLDGADAADLRREAQAQARAAAAPPPRQVDPSGPSVPAPAGPLARNRALLADSRLRREALSSLLEVGE